MNNASTDPSSDGWQDIAAPGDIFDADAGIVYRIDAKAIRAIVTQFSQEAAKPNFGGLLVDYDRNSLSPDKSSEAAGWTMAMREGEGRLEAKIAWTVPGESHVEGKNFRSIAPFYAGSSETLGQKKIGDKSYPIVRPGRIDRLALTNRPSEIGGRLIKNRQRPEAGSRSLGHSEEESARMILNRALTLSLTKRISFAEAWRQTEGQFRQS